MFKVYTLRDRQSGLFGRPVCSLALGLVVRELTDLVNSGRQGEPLVDHPEDFQLYALGEFDDSKGVFTLLPLPDMVLDCAQLVRPSSMPVGHVGNGAAIPAAPAPKGTGEVSAT